MDIQTSARRRFLTRLGLGTAAGMLTPPFTHAWAWGAFADELTRTPRQTEGPFYPDRLPLDTDNDLLILGDSLTPAVGEVTNLSGRVLDLNGDPIRGVLVEIWQCDANGSYLHTAGQTEKRDKGFQGYGRFETASDGGYRFRTIKPVPYPGRTPHIHVKLTRGQRELLTTQLYIKGHPQNDRDGILRSVRDPKARETLLVDFRKIEDSRVGELAARFDIVLGLTPPEAPAGEPHVH
jgi:protocatechuate 3,4-dioxygenase beta subunit